MKRSLLIKCLSIFFILAIWQITSKTISNELVFPSPSAVFSKIIELSLNGTLLKQSSTTFLRVMIGIFISLTVGLFIGILLGINKKLYTFTLPIVSIFQSAPAISWILLALIWFSASLTPVFLIIASIVPIIIINVTEGILQTDQKLIDMAKLYKVPLYRIIYNIYIPSVTGYLYSSLRIIMSLALKSAVMAEVLSYPDSGIGKMMSVARFDIDTTSIFAWTVIIMFAAYILDQGLNLIKMRLSKND